MPMKSLRTLRLYISCILTFSAFSVLAGPHTLIVVEDRGGVSALPYYEVLDLQPQVQPVMQPLKIPAPPTQPYREADMLPVRSTQLTPGQVSPRVIHAPGLSPMFIIGDDPHSHRWLSQRAAFLQEINAVGLVVNVESAPALEALRRLVPGLRLSPVSGDDLAHRLNLRHYPVVITATGIEQ